MQKNNGIAPLVQKILPFENLAFQSIKQQTNKQTYNNKTIKIGFSIEIYIDMRKINEIAPLVQKISSFENLAFEPLARPLYRYYIVSQYYLYIILAASLLGI